MDGKRLFENVAMMGCLLTGIGIASASEFDALRETCDIYRKKLPRKQLEFQSCDVNGKILGKSLLSCAVRLGDFETVKLLLGKGANPDGIQILDEDEGWANINRRRIMNGYKALYDDDDIPLCIAARKGYYKIARLLLKYGANPNGEDSSIPLKEAVRFCCFKDLKVGLKLVKLLLRKGANPNQQERFLELVEGAPLNMAAALGADVEVIDTLVDAGANVDEKNKKTGNTPLHEATRNGNYEQVEILIDKRADIDELNHAKQTPLDLAVIQRNKLKQEIIRADFENSMVKFDIDYKYRRTIDLLREHGAKIGKGTDVESDGEEEAGEK
jgi:ankyrin repeat protein